MFPSRARSIHPPTHMRTLIANAARTLSGRIVLGFATLTIAFAVIAATLVVNMGQVEDQVILIGKGYMPLALVAKDLQRSQDDLNEFLKNETFPLDPGKQLQLKRLRGRRDEKVGNLR